MSPIANAHKLSIAFPRISHDMQLRTLQRPGRMDEAPRLMGRWSEWVWWIGDWTGCDHHVPPFSSSSRPTLGILSSFTRPLPLCGSSLFPSSSVSTSPTSAFSGLGYNPIPFLRRHPPLHFMDSPTRCVYSLSCFPECPHANVPCRIAAIRTTQPVQRRRPLRLLASC